MNVWQKKIVGGKRIEKDRWTGFEVEVWRGDGQGRQGVRLGWGQEEVEVDEEGGQLEKD